MAHVYSTNMDKQIGIDHGVITVNHEIINDENEYKATAVK